VAKFVYNGEQELVLPTLGLTVAPGDVIEAPTDFVVDGFAPSKDKVTKVSDADPIVAEPVEAPVEAIPDSSADASAPAATDTAPAETN